jgi:hypothetical protein
MPPIVARRFRTKRRPVDTNATCPLIVLPAMIPADFQLHRPVWGSRMFVRWMLHMTNWSRQSLATHVLCVSQRKKRRISINYQQTPLYRGAYWLQSYLQLWGFLKPFPLFFSLSETNSSTSIHPCSILLNCCWQVC